MGHRPCPVRLHPPGAPAVPGLAGGRCGVHHLRRDLLAHPPHGDHRDLPLHPRARRRRRGGRLRQHLPWDGGLVDLHLRHDQGARQSGQDADGAAAAQGRRAGGARDVSGDHGLDGVRGDPDRLQDARALEEHEAELVARGLALPAGVPGGRPLLPGGLPGAAAELLQRGGLGGPRLPRLPGGASALVGPGLHRLGQGAGQELLGQQGSRSRDREADRPEPDDHGPEVAGRVRLPRSEGLARPRRHAPPRRRDRELRADAALTLEVPEAGCGGAGGLRLALPGVEDRQERQGGADGGDLPGLDPRVRRPCSARSRRGARSPGDGSIL